MDKYHHHGLTWASVVDGAGNSPGQEETHPNMFGTSERERLGSQSSGQLIYQKRPSMSHGSMQQQHLPVSAVSNQHQNIPGNTVGRQKLFHSQGASSRASSESETLAVDWHDQAYQRVLEVKSEFGQKLQLLHKLFTSFCNKPASAEEIQGYKTKLGVIENQIKFLSLQPRQITNFSEDEVGRYLELIVRFVTSYEKKFSASVEGNAHKKADTQSQSSQKPQNLNAKQQQFHPVSLALTSSLGRSSPGSIMQPGPPTSQPKSLCSPLQSGTRTELEQWGELSQLQYSANSVGENDLDGQWDKLSGNTIGNVHDLEPKHPTMLSQVPKQYMQMPTASLHPFEQQADVSVSGVHQPEAAGSQSNIFNRQLHQPRTGVLQQSVAMIPEQSVQNTTQPAQFHQILPSPKQQIMSHDGTQQHLQMSAVSNQHRSVPGSAVDRQKLLHSKSMFSGASSGSKTPDELAVTVDWHAQAYRRILEVKRQFGPKLQFLHNLFTSFCNKAASAEVIQDYKNNLRLIEKQMVFLSLQQHQITNFSKEKVDRYLELILRFVTFFQKKISGLAERHSHQQPGTRSQSSQQLQNLNVRQQFQPPSSALTSSIGRSSTGSVMQPGPPTSQPENLFSPPQHNSRIGLEQRNELSTLQHPATSAGESDLGGQRKKLSGYTIVNVYDSEPKHSTMLHKEPKQHMQLHNLQQKEKHVLMPRMESGVALDIKYQLCATSQNSQHSSPQIGRLTSQPNLPNSETSLRSANSPSVISSSSFMALSTVPPDHEGHKASFASLSEKTGCLESLAGADTQSQVQPLSPAIISDISVSPVITASPTYNGNQQSSHAMQPIERLLKAIKSSSQQALSASIYEIELAVKEADAIIGTTSTDSMLAVGEDLVSTRRCQLQAWNFGSPDMGLHVRRTKRQITALASSTTDSHMNSNENIFQSDSTTTPGNKRRRIEPSNDLLDEIRQINQKLLETVVEFDSTKDAVALTGGNEGIIVRFSYRAVAFNENFKAYASTLKLPVLSLWLLVPESYPNSSPQVLEGSSLGWSLENKGCRDPLDKAELRFRATLQKLSEPMSLGEMAKTWDVCARAVVFEQAQLIGGECFSSRYGTWEKFIAA